MVKFKRFVVGEINTNCYVVWDNFTKECLIVDPGGEPDKIIKYIENKKLKPVFIINTHGHIDHILNNREIKDKFKIPLYIHRKDKLCLSKAENNFQFMINSKYTPAECDRSLKGGEKLKLGTHKLEVISTPGHSPGHIIIKIDNILITGDLLFKDSIGRTDLPFASEIDMDNSLKLVFELEYGNESKVQILPGHGELSNLKQEKEHNPFLSSFAQMNSSENNILDY